MESEYFLKKFFLVFLSNIIQRDGFLSVALRWLCRSSCEHVSGCVNPYTCVYVCGCVNPYIRVCMYLLAELYVVYCMVCVQIIV